MWLQFKLKQALFKLFFTVLPNLLSMIFPDFKLETKEEDQVRASALR